MKPYVALFRGINVGGNNILRMKDLIALLETLDAYAVKTYIQSGNVVFQHQEDDAARLSGRISAAVKASHGFEPRVLLLDAATFSRAVVANPYPQAESEPKTVHLYFLASRPRNPNLQLLNSLKKDSEQFELTDKVFYLHAPDGIGRSKLAERVERALGVAATARNWRTVSRIKAMIER